MRIFFLMVMCLFYPLNTQDLSIRPYDQKTDYTQVKNILEKNERFLLRNISTEWVLDKIMMKVDLNMEGFQNYSNCETKVIKSQDNVMGFIVYVPYIQSGGGHIKLLAIDETHRKNGYGTRLIKDAVKDIGDKTKDKIYYFPRNVTVDVFDWNIDAINFYKKMGFWYYPFDNDGDNPHRYRLRIDPLFGFFIHNYPKLSLACAYGLIAQLYFMLRAFKIQS